MAQVANPHERTDDAPPTVPFTIKADLDVGAALAPWLRASGADVTIRRGDVPTALPAPEAEGVVWQHASRRTLFLLPCGVRFLIEDGRTVRYAMERGATPRDVQPFVLGNVWGVLAMQRGLLPLHASAVSREPGLHAFTGPSGAGKSTLAAALASRGYPLFADDILLVDPASFDGGPLCYGHRTLSLCRKSLALIGIEAAVQVPMRQRLPRWYAVPALQTPPRADRLQRLYILSYWNNIPGSPPCSVERITGRLAVHTLWAAVYHPRQAAAIMGRRRVLSLLARLARGTRVSVFHRRRSDPDVTWFAEDVARLAAELEAS